MKKNQLFFYSKMKNNCSLIFVISIMLLCFNACKIGGKKNALDNPSVYYKGLFTGKEKNVFRNINFNLSNEEVKKIETAKLYEATPDHLFYEFSYPKDSSAFLEYANIQYYFNENNHLDIITTDIFVNDSIQEEKLKRTINQNFSDRFGTEVIEENGYKKWKAETNDKKENDTYKYTIAMKDLEDDFGVSIEFMKE